MMRRGPIIIENLHLTKLYLVFLDTKGEGRLKASYLDITEGDS
jgi:hypothetical protein